VTDSIGFITGSIRGRQKVKLYTRKHIQDLPGHHRMDPAEKKFKNRYKYKKEVTDK
jgi:hypothetical protein